MVTLTFMLTANDCGKIIRHFLADKPVNQ